MIIFVILDVGFGFEDGFSVDDLFCVDHFVIHHYGMIRRDEEILKGFVFSEGVFSDADGGDGGGEEEEGAGCLDC